MKRRFLMVSAMILLLGSQVDMYAQKKGEPDFKKPGMEMQECKKPGKEFEKKHICKQEVEGLQNFYWKRYKIKLSYKEAEKILLADMKDKRGFDHRPGPAPDPRGPQKPPRK